MDSPSLYLNIEVFAGTNIETAAEEAIALAMRLQVTVRFLFNLMVLLAMRIRTVSCRNW